MPSTEEQAGSNSIAGNGGVQPTDATTKMGADAQNTNVNSSLQPATPAMQASPPATPDDNGTVPPPSTEELFDTEQSVGQGAVEPGGEQDNREANPDDVAAPADSHQPNTYGGNFGNDVQNSFQDHDRASNQRGDANRGEFGQQEYNHGATHGGYGNQYRETDFAATHNPAAEATEEKYYGQGSAAPGPQHNAYRSYDGRDLAPDQQGHAVRDTPPTASGQPSSQHNLDSQGNAIDNRNLPGRTDARAAHQNDSGAYTTGGGYAADYGHTSGVGLPAGTPGNYRPSQPGDLQQAPAGSVPATGQGAPAPVNSPDAPQGPGYGYGHERSEQAQPGNPNTGDARNGFGPNGPKEGDVSQGHGSQGGSYDDQNPGARGPEYDKYTNQDKAQNYGQDKREEFRPAEDKPAEGDYGAVPRRNAGRDEASQ